MESIKGIIFDYGGTIDSRGDHWYHVIGRAYREEGLELSRDAYIAGERGIQPLVSRGDTMLNLLEKKIRIQLQSIGISDATLAWRIARNCDNKTRECVNRSRKVLESLGRRYTMAVVSNFYGNLDTVLRTYGIRHLFRSVTDSGRVGVRKPDSAIFRIGLDSLGLTGRETLVVGDSVSKDIVPATALGCHTALIKGVPWDESLIEEIPTGTLILPDIESLSEYL